MRFLADESCDFAVVTALRNAGHDITAIAETSPGVEDEVSSRWPVPKHYDRLGFQHVDTSGVYHLMEWAPG